MVLRSSSRAQKSISLSSAESEYNSMVSGACDAILVKACINFVAPPECQVSEVSLFVDNSAARSIASRQGVGRTRHLEGKILWLQDKVKQGVFVPRPVPTSDNVSDLGTKVLKADRVAYLLSKCNIRDLSCGNALVGKSQILDAEERYRIRRILSQNTVSTSQVLQVLAIALQVASAQGGQSGDDSDDDDSDSWMSLVVSMIGYALAVVEQYPIALAVVCQIILLGLITCIMWRRLKPNVQVGESGSAHPSGWQPRQNLQVHVNVGDRAFAKPLRGPEPIEDGLPAPGTPARPLRVETDDEGDMFEVPSVQVMPEVQGQRPNLARAGQQSIRELKPEVPMTLAVTCHMKQVLGAMIPCQRRGQRLFRSHPCPISCVFGLHHIRARSSTKEVAARRSKCPWS